MNPEEAKQLVPEKDYVYWRSKRYKVRGTIVKGGKLYIKVYGEHPYIKLGYLSAVDCSKAIRLFREGYSPLDRVSENFSESAKK